MQGPPCAFNQIRVSPGSRHGLPWAFLRCYTQGSFCLQSISEAPFPVAMQDACCLLDVEAFSHLFLTGSHRKMMRLEPISTEHNGPPSRMSQGWHGGESITASAHCVFIHCAWFLLHLFKVVLTVCLCLPCCSATEKSHRTARVRYITINLDMLIHRYVSFSWSHNRLTVSTGRHAEKRYHYIWKPPGHFWLSTPGYITFKESKKTEKKSWFTFRGWIESKSILRSNMCSLLR